MRDSQVEDIVDSGHTAKKLKEYFLSLGAKSVRLATLLDKSERRSVDIKIDYCGFWVMLCNAPSHQNKTT